jgi:hypothetical protein
VNQLPILIGEVDVVCAKKTAAARCDKFNHVNYTKTLTLRNWRTHKFALFFQTGYRARFELARARAQNGARGGACMRMQCWCDAFLLAAILHGAFRYGRYAK